MRNLPFLTLPDPNAQVKGSRDPLGIQEIWSYFGRKVVGNLTTVSNSVHGFTTTLLGFYFAENIRAQEPKLSTAEIFLKWEQMVAYTRIKLCDAGGEVRGVERVRKNLANSDTVKISASRDRQILSNQAMYGLYGLFSGPARVSGLLIEGGKLTSEARQHVEQNLLPFLNQNFSQCTATILSLLTKAEFDYDVRESNRVSAAIAELMQSDKKGKPKLLPATKKFYQEHLLYGGKQNAVRNAQTELAALFTEATEFHSWRLWLLATLQESTLSAVLRTRLELIVSCDGLMTLATALFNYLLSVTNQTKDDVAEQVQAVWKNDLPLVNDYTLQYLLPEIQNAIGDSEITSLWRNLATNLIKRDFAECIDLIIKINHWVMQARSGTGPWLTVEDGKIKVKTGPRNDSLPEPEALVEAWYFDYFLNSLYRIEGELR